MTHPPFFSIIIGIAALTATVCLCSCARKAPAYIKGVDSIVLPSGCEVVALGEAAHGNKEFQDLKLEVFRQMVRREGVRAFALESDFMGGVMVNSYIHGESSEDAHGAVRHLLFNIYQTQQMVDLIQWMREYNDTAASGQKLNFYGFDMQNCEKPGEESGSEVQDSAVVQQEERCVSQRNLLQSSGLSKYAQLRDSCMAANVLWVLERERALGRGHIMISGHNGHIAKKDPKMRNMGSWLAEKLGSRYFAIGSDYSRTRVNIAKRSGVQDNSGKRTVTTFRSGDPLAKQLRGTGVNTGYVDFRLAEEFPELKKMVTGNMSMGSLGEAYAVYMHLIPRSARIKAVPADLYDAMIVVYHASPTKIK